MVAIRNEHITEETNGTGGSHCLVAGPEGIRTAGPLLPY